MTTSLLTDSFAYGHAASGSWRAAAEACLEQCGSRARNATLGFVYATDAFADDFGELVDFLRRRTNIPHWVGTVGLGICASGREYLDEPALAIMCCNFEKDSFRVLPMVSSARETARTPVEWSHGAANFAVLHADPSNPSLTSIVRTLAGRMGSNYVVGGLTSSRGRGLQYADGVTEGGLSGVLFSDEVVVATRHTQGCVPLGPRHKVTEARSNVLIRLDGRPALDVLREDIGPALASDLRSAGGYVFAALPIEGSDAGDYIVRNLVGVDTRHKLVAVAEGIGAGGEMMFCKRDRGAASDDLERMLKSIQSGLYRPPRGAVYFSCLGRGASLFGENSEELRLIQDGLGDVPLVGFFCNGEISHNRLYGYTGVLTLFL
jgi:small ligand-binding sensory domain FIST